MGAWWPNTVLVWIILPPGALLPSGIFRMVLGKSEIRVVVNFLAILEKHTIAEHSRAWGNTAVIYVYLPVCEQYQWLVTGLVDLIPSPDWYSRVAPKLNCAQDFNTWKVWCLNQSVVTRLARRWQIDCWSRLERLWRHLIWNFSLAMSQIECRYIYLLISIMTFKHLIIHTDWRRMCNIYVLGL